MYILINNFQTWNLNELPTPVRIFRTTVPGDFYSAQRPNTEQKSKDSVLVRNYQNFPGWLRRMNRIAEGIAVCDCSKGGRTTAGSSPSHFVRLSYLCSIKPCNLPQLSV